METKDEIIATLLHFEYVSKRDGNKRVYCAALRYWTKQAELIGLYSDDDGWMYPSYK